MKDFKKGFTIVELSLSIAFIGILSITIVLIINNTIVSYRRGIVLNQINTVGMDIVDDMRAAVQNSPGRSLLNECSVLYEGKNAESLESCLLDGGKKLVSVTRDAVVRINGQDKTVPVFGAFCTGKYSYIWNSGYFFSNEYQIENNLGAATLKYKKSDTETPTVENFKLLKVEDDQRAVCISAINGYGKNGNGPVYNNQGNRGNLKNEFDISDLSVIMYDEPVEVLSKSGENNLAIYDVEVAKPAEGGEMNNIFYAVSFILGTVQGGINVKTAGNFCATPNDYENENFDYCAINKFNFAVQANGE